MHANGTLDSSDIHDTYDAVPRLSWTGNLQPLTPSFLGRDRPILDTITDT